MHGHRHFHDGQYGNRFHNLYRSKHGIIFGVCQGLAEWRDLPVGSIRLFVIVAFFMTGFFPIGVIYLLMGFFLPVRDSRDFRDEESYGARFRRNRSATMSDIKEEFEGLKSRVMNMEADMFDKEKDWDKRFYDKG